MDVAIRDNPCSVSRNGARALQRPSVAAMLISAGNCDGSNPPSDERSILTPEKIVGPVPLWRGSLLPLGCEADLIPCNSFPQTHRSARFYGGRAAEREQAPSPQGHLASYRPVAAVEIDAYGWAVADLNWRQGFAAL
ncbi:hypothetical protein EMIT0196MI5_220019 [Pseudomonas sp. IT-196MI5]